MTVVQWNEFVQCCQATDMWQILKRRSGFVSAHEACNRFVKPWTRGTGRGVALNMNAAAPIEAQLMLSHNWAEDLTECAEALNTHCRRNGLTASTSVWFCLFSNYQAGDEEGDIGPTVAEQLAMDPFGHVIRSVREQRGMLVIHTSRAEVYERLWCVYEIATALREDCTTRSACSQRYADTGRRRLQSVLDVNTTKAKCSSTNDEAFICDRVSKSGGFERLDREIFQFRVSMLLEQAEEAGHNRLESLTKAITKVEKRLELENSSSSSGGWASKLGGHPSLCLMLAFLALGGIALAALLTHHHSRAALSDVGTTPAVVTTPPTTTPPVSTTATSTPPHNWGAATTPPAGTATSDSAGGSGGGESTTGASRQEQTSPWGGPPLVRSVVLIGGAVAMLASLAVIILLTRRLGCCSTGGGDAAGDLPRQTSLRVQLERLEIVRKRVEQRVLQLDRQAGVESV
mmetsp:Transcript_53382/g.139118  ORF Transcript_53382/g.139118 Transcript_53382/m.139118 type:complete len:459 (-) Transcript_53382:1192-2568(-)